MRLALRLAFHGGITVESGNRTLGKLKTRASIGELLLRLWEGLGSLQSGLGWLGHAELVLGLLRDVELVVTLRLDEIPGQLAEKDLEHVTVLQTALLIG